MLVDHAEVALFQIEHELGPNGIRRPRRLPADIRDKVKLRALFETRRPDIVFHAAAHKHVPMMEANPGEAVKNNVLGTRTLVDERASRAGVERFVMISTDKAVNPTSVMGASKRSPR